MCIWVNRIEIGNGTGSGTNWGGLRRGAGRKPKQPGRPGISHARLPAHLSRHPVHVSLKTVVRCLRNQQVFRAIRHAVRAVNRARQHEFRVIHFSVQADHIHLLLEAEHRDALSCGMKALNARVAKAVNSLLQRRGRLFVDRFHRSVLTTARSVRNTIIYVLSNFRKHRTWEARQGWLIDPCSSARYFVGFLEGNPVDPRLSLFPNPAGSPVVPARTWLLKTAWKRHGLISLHDRPRAADPHASKSPPWEGPATA